MHTYKAGHENEDEFEDTKGVIGFHKCKNRQHNGQKKKE
jgi:hypothetical protein